MNKNWKLIKITATLVGPERCAPTQKEKEEMLKFIKRIIHSYLCDDYDIVIEEALVPQAEYDDIRRKQE